MDENKNMKNLYDRYKRNIYTVPEGYFDELSGRILKRCFVKPTYYPLFFQTLYFKTAIVISSVLIVLFIGKNFIKNNEMTNSTDYAIQLDKIESEDFISSYPFSATDIVELYSMTPEENDNFISIFNSNDLI